MTESNVTIKLDNGHGHLGPAWIVEIDGRYVGGPYFRRELAEEVARTARQDSKPGLKTRTQNQDSKP
jgi:hypothetical protein